ncbi:MAG TPA: hypothetical protein VM223_09370, partial [Planctomycetota bacterium]|nr:hypothetical protein [Planctomycetota bacterium]
MAAGLLALLVAVGMKYVPPYQPPVELAGDVEASYKRIADAVSGDAISADIEKLCADGSRAIGTPGYERAVEYIRSRFERAGMQDVIVLRYPVTIPVTKVARLEVIGQTRGSAPTDDGSAEEVQIYPMWPNIVRTCTVPPDGLTGRLIDAGDGELRRFNGKDVNGAIVLLDADCDRRWLNVPLLGGAAVILCGSEKFTRAQAEVKSLTTPVNVPRFFVNEADANRLRRLAAGGGRSVRISCRVDLEDAQAATICGILPGSDPRFSRETLVLDAYFDSISQVPDLAPGAEASCGIAALLQAAELFGRERPRRTILFVANGAHFLGKGFERFLHVIGRRVPNQDTSIMVKAQIADCDQRLADLAARLERCEREARLIEVEGEGQAGPVEWSSADEDVRRQIVHDIQMSIKAVLDDAFEAARKSGVENDELMPRPRRLALQRMCWESSLEKLCSASWAEVHNVLPRLRSRVEQRRAELTGNIERLSGERRFLQSIAKLNLKLFLGLDLSTATRSFGMYERGNLDTPPYEGRGPVQPLADRMMSFAEKMEEVVFGEKPDDADAGGATLPRFVHSFKAINNVPPRSYVIAMMKFDVEACYYGPNWTAATFCTLNDSRRYLD